MLALDHFQKNSEQYLLVVSDIRLPIIDGYQFIKKVKEIKPDVRVFCMSAFLSDDVQYRTGLTLVNVDEYIEKPVSVNDFIRLVKRNLLQRVTGYTLELTSRLRKCNNRYIMIVIYRITGF